MCGNCGGQNAERAIQIRAVGDVNPCEKEYQWQQQPVKDRTHCIGDYEKHLYEEQEEDFCDKGPREPFQIPGYAGHVPTLQSRSGHTYGQDTHEVLIAKADQTFSSSGKGSHICPVPLHEPYHVPGYTGHVPGLQQMVGGTYGQDTHKLLYTIKPYPNREENLSPYRPEKANGMFGDGRGLKEHSYREENSTYPNKKVQFTQSEASAKTDTYKKPDEYYLQPQYKYRIGDTYTRTADLTLVDPCVNQESKVIVSTRELDDTQVVRPQNTLEERVEGTPYINQPIRHRPMVPGFDAFVDAMRGARGQRFEFTARSPEHLQLQQQLILQKGKIKEPRKSVGPAEHHSSSQSPYQPSGDDLPYGYAKYGNKQRYTNSVLYDFASNYRRRQSTEWAPAGISRPDPPAFDIPGEIYSKHTGLLPGYSAHVPGAMFRCGRTFTDDSRDARRALRGDRL